MFIVVILFFSEDDDSEVNDLIKKLEEEADRRLAGHENSKMETGNIVMLL